HFAQQGVAALVGAAELDAPARYQSWILFAGGRAEPAGYDAFGHGLQSLFHDVGGALQPAVGGADDRAGVGQGGGQQSVGMLAQQLLADDAADGGAGKVKLVGTSAPGEGDGFLGQVFGFDGAGILGPGAAGAVAGQ